MAKEVDKVVKLQVRGGAANPSEINNRNTSILNEQKDDSINKYRDFFND